LDEEEHDFTLLFGNEEEQSEIYEPSGKKIKTNLTESLTLENKFLTAKNKFLENKLSEERKSSEELKKASKS
jgi:hypothetical protein